jgi:hypothetical protein
MNHRILLYGALLALAGLGCQKLGSAGTAGAAQEDEGEEVEISLAEVPQAAKDAALAAVPGLVLEEAARETEDGATIYCLEGEAGGVEYELEVTADGRVLDIESEEEEDDDGAEGDAEDEDDED